MKLTRVWDKATFIIHIPPFFVMCSNCYTRIFNRCPPSFASMTLMVFNAIWYDICNTQKGLYPVSRLAQIEILHKSWACTTLQSDLIGPRWVELELLWFLFSSLIKPIIHFKINVPSMNCQCSHHPASLSLIHQHCTDIELARNLTYSLYENDLPL